MTYLKEGKLTIEGIEIKEGWLQITKTFKKKYLEHETLKVHSQFNMAIMLDFTFDEKLKMTGVAREMTT